MAADFPVRAVLDDKGIDMLIAALTKAGKQANMTEKEIKEMNDQVKKTGSEGVGHVNNLNKNLNNLVNDGLKRVGSAFLAAFAFDRLVNVAKQVIAITAEFQKFEAVLTNALGSRSQAQLGMQMLAKFAAETPFAVNELTSSYVKLVNQGFIPGRDEMRKLGDLAASTGKTFDMLTEAIIDAQTGEFERLKEFGIRASKEGDRVKFTFKGVKTEVDFTAKSIREYVLGLGDAEGVSGSMAAISKTLGGQISNLGDSWDTLLRTLGEGNSGIMSQTVSLLKDMLDHFTDLIKTKEQLKQEDITEDIANELEFFKKYAEGFDDITEARDRWIKQLEDSILAGEAKRAELMRGVTHEMDKQIDAIEAQIDSEKKRIQAIKDFVTVEQKKAQTTEESTKAVKTHHKAVKDFIDEVMAPYFEATRKQNKEQAEYNRLLKFSKELMENINNIPPSFNVDTSTFEEIEPEDDSDGVDIEGLKKKLRDKEEFKRAIAQETFDFTVGLIQTMRDIEAQRDEDERHALEAQRDHELELAGDNSKAKERINREFDEKQRQLKIKQAQRDKEQAVFNIAVSTAQGVMAALASVPPNVPLSILIGLAGLAQAGLVASKPLPKFAHGVFDLKGPGTGTSDSITARLSRGESVTPAAASQKFADILKPIIENPNLTYADIKSIIDQKIPSNVRDLTRVNPGRDGGSELINELRQFRKVMENKKETHLSIDKDGLRVWTTKQLEEVEYMNNRYSS